MFKFWKNYFIFRKHCLSFFRFFARGEFKFIYSYSSFRYCTKQACVNFKKMISHEKSKKLYFLFYLIAISYILSQCLILVTSSNSDTSDQGILLLYIYVTATLMLFLIFLALTTCESYLYKDLNKNGLVNNNSIFKIAVNVIFLIFVISYYDNLISGAIDTYYIKLAIMSDSGNRSYHNLELNNFLSGATKYSSMHKVKDTSSNWSIFDNLKYDIIDNYTNYALSALLQTCALIIVILSVVV